MLESTSNYSSNPNNPKWLEILASIGGLLLWIVFVTGGLALLLTLLFGMLWFTSVAFPWISLIAAVALFAVIPMSLILAIFRNTRGIGGLGLYISSYIAGLHLWMFSLVIAYQLAGIFWIIVGLVLGGIGVVPVAFIASLFSREWTLAFQVLVYAIIVYALRISGNYLVERIKTKKEFTKQTSDSTLERSVQITREFGDFLAERAPTIWDESLLPYPKFRIKSALLEYEQHLCDVANSYKKTDLTEELPQIDQLLSSLRECRVALLAYSRIEAEDSKEVAYFNQFKNIDEIPASLQTRWAELYGKYMSKGMNETFPDWEDTVKDASKSISKEEWAKILKKSNT